MHGLLRAKAFLAAAVLLGALLLRAWSSAGPVAEEFRRAAPGRLGPELRTSLDQRIARSLGPGVDVLHALQRVVPRDGRVFVRGRGAAIDGVLFLRIRTLLYPTSVFALTGIEPDWRPEPAGLDARTFLLDLNPQAPLAARELFEPVELGAGFLLMRAAAGAGE